MELQFHSTNSTLARGEAQVTGQTPAPSREAGAAWGGADGGG